MARFVRIAPDAVVVHMASAKLIAKQCSGCPHGRAVKKCALCSGCPHPSVPKYGFPKALACFCVFTEALGRRAQKGFAIYGLVR